MRKILIMLIISLISVLMIGCTGVSKDIDAPNASLETEVDGVTGIRLSATRKNSMSDSESEISTATILTTTVTATIEGSGELTWSLSCPSSSSLVISNYVTMSVSDDTLSVDISCSNAFGYQLILRASSGSVYAECTLDYAKRVKNISVSNVKCTNDASIGANLIVTDIVDSSNYTTLTNTITDNSGIFSYANIFSREVKIVFEGINQLVGTGTVSSAVTFSHMVRLSDGLKTAFTDAGLSYNSSSIEVDTGTITTWLRSLTMYGVTSQQAAVIAVLGSVDCWFVYRITATQSINGTTYAYYEDFKISGFNIDAGGAM